MYPKPLDVIWFRVISFDAVSLDFHISVNLRKGLKNGKFKNWAISVRI